MDLEYGALIRDAWQTTWRHRFLWILGLFAGGAVGVSFGGGAGGNGGADRRRFPPRTRDRSPPTRRGWRTE